MHGHWYIINANFQEALREQLSCSLPNLSKAHIFSNMSVTKEEKVARQFLKSSTDVLKLIKIQYTSEWPLEIVIDKSTIIKKYNIILRLLLQVKYAKYVMEKRDYHLKRPNLLRYSHSYSFGRKKQEEVEEMGARERLMIENELMLGRLVQQLQMFQRELLHFITTMDDYFMNRATYLECIRFMEALDRIKTDAGKDLDDLIEVHDSYLQRVMQLCLLDLKSQELLRYIMDIVEISQDFRKLIRQYLLTPVAADYDSDNSFDINSDQDEGQKQFTGMGILQFSSNSFVTDLSECQSKLNFLRDKFEKHVKILTVNLNKLTKTQSGKIILSYLLEILQRLNFNSFYVSREDEDLPAEKYLD